MKFISVVNLNCFKSGNEKVKPFEDFILNNTIEKLYYNNSIARPTEVKYQANKKGADRPPHKNCQLLIVNCKLVFEVSRPREHHTHPVRVAEVNRILILYRSTWLYHGFDPLM